ncbi:anthranilate N-methyltransferase isoform X2 [Arachis ipaensis]|uniref:anthranilate N-methyltransferase isoform X2 n=1 Tax=Arachis ipaensis TaxID=130454 RepID=UPI0007AFC8CD|nr:anthranilate N-methyltransferase isoform X2 [Arachis ipaensis]
MAPSLESNKNVVIDDESNKNLLKEEEEDGMLFAMDLGILVAFPMAVKTAFELGIFDIMAKGGEHAKLSSEDIASQIGSINPNAPSMVDRLLRLLASHSLLSCSSLPQVTKDENDQEHELIASPQKIVYSLTAAASKYFVSDDDGVNFGHSLSLILDKVFLESWSELKGAILEGGVPFVRVNGMHAFEYPSVDPRFNDVFNKAMISHTTIVMKRVLESYEGFNNINTLIDVGGGLGINLKMITSKYPNINAINFDLPHVIQHALTYPGVKHVGGDMFESVPNGDAIFMKCILHDWSDEHCLKVLKNCHKAIPEDGKVIVVDIMVPVLPGNTTAAKVAFKADLLMMTQNIGGKERTKRDFIHLATLSGFSSIKFVCSVSGYWVMEFYK